MNKEELKKMAKSKIDQAKIVESMIKSSGWEVFESIFNKKIEEVKEKDNYKTIQDFKADRKAIKILDSIIKDLKDIVLEAEEANKTLDKLNERK